MESHTIFLVRKAQNYKHVILPKLIYELKVIAKNKTKQNIKVNMLFETRQANYKAIVGKKNQKVK